MVKINATVRAAVRQVLADSTKYDASTMRIARDGNVSALKDANKTFAGNDSRRYNVGFVFDLVNQDGTRCQGY